MDGLLVIDKPAGPTSHDVVERLRRTLREKRIGHTGTLDPSATGVLPLVVGRATRLARFLTGATKEYRAAIRLGIATDTYDVEGVPQQIHAGPLPGRQTIEQALLHFHGTHLQQPPAYSAKKVAGERSHRLARRAAGGGGVATRPAAVEVTAYRLDVVSLEGSLLEIEVECSAGFYVRTLAHDLGERLGVGGHLESLRRTRSGDITLADAVPLADVDGNREAALAALVPLRRMLPSLPAIHLTDEQARFARQGRVLALPAGLATQGTRSVPEWSGDTPPLRLFDPSGELVGIGRAAVPGQVHAFVVLAPDLR